MADEVYPTRLSRNFINPSASFHEFTTADIEQSIPQRFEEQVRSNPFRLAIKSGEDAWTYETLHAFSNQIAHLILEECGSAEEPVALLFAQGAPLIAAILGVLKTGKIYVPLDSSYPRSRLSNMLDDANTHLILSDENNSALAEVFTSDVRRARSLNLINPKLSTTNVSERVTPDTLAYIFYTSGSTGKPKGVVDNHRNVLHNIMRYTNNLKISSEDRLTLLQSCSFSGSVSSLFCGLLNGATVFPYDVQREGFAMIGEWLNHEKITMYHSVPMIFRGFLLGEQSFPHVRVIRLEGDQASKLDVELYKRYFGDDCVLVNGLGATETGISRQYFVTKATQLPDSNVPIGYPTQDMDVLLLDKDGVEVGANSVGEIAVKSRYLAVGYWKNSERTNAVFLPDPAGGSERIYRTGDMGRMLTDGCLEYLGRKDFGMKIRGQRVEASEVERAILDIPGVKEAVVTIRNDRSDDPRLVAYIVPQNAVTLTAHDLRNELALTLPALMIPSGFVIMDALPLNANKKVDRAALPELDMAQADLTKQHMLPRTPMEHQLQSLWEDVLGVRPIGVLDNFFDAGGNSLLVARLFTKIAAALGKHIPLATIFSAPTIEQLARILERDSSIVSKSLLVATQPHGRKPPLYCIHDGHGDPFLYVDLARELGIDQPMYSLQSAAYVGERTLPKGVIEMAGKYIQEIKRIQQSGPYHLCGSCFGGIVAFEMAQQFLAQGDEVSLLIILDVTPPDFPYLVSTLAKWRFRRYNWAETVKHHVREVRSHGAVSFVKYLIDVIGRKMNLANTAQTSYGAQNGVTLEWLRKYHQTVSREYVPTSYPGCLHLFLWKEVLKAYSRDPLDDWSRLASRGVIIHQIPGASGWMTREPHVGAIAEQLRDCLNASQARRKEEQTI